ncbi:MAG: hypothetical protein NE327_15060 [Lentisphaeraceae bacterium]|nr:hypothetical protein [Lentisphaeraceae bacterium]
MKKYIVNIEDIGELTTAAALQDSKIFLEKDTQSSFYIAHLEDSVEIPNEIRALEMQRPVKSSGDEKSVDSKKFLDLRLCIEIPQQINKKEIEETLCKEISKTLKTLIKNKESN